MYELIATSTFGLEAVVKRELIALGFEVRKVENGKVTFLGDKNGIVKANLWLRTADRVLLKMGEFKATTFDELFDQTNTIKWEEVIPVDGKVIVNGKSVKSKLFSIRDCQKMVKKSVSKRLMSRYRTTWLEEKGSAFTVLVSLLNDIATLTIDTSGEALHKRGYRVETVTAPMKETLAAALIQLSYWHKDRALYDVFCGSGTIPIEAALIGKNIAPGLGRDFAFKHWKWISNDIWKKETSDAYKAINHDVKLKIFASDINNRNLNAARENAIEAGVDEDIVFQNSDFKDVDYSIPYSVIISNPPYGERLNDDSEVKKLYKDMGKVFKRQKTNSMYFVTSYTDFEKVYNKAADRQRKLYNGRIEVRYYQYYGERPPKGYFDN